MDKQYKVGDIVKVRFNNEGPIHVGIVTGDEVVSAAGHEAYSVMFTDDSTYFVRADEINQPKRPTNIQKVDFF